MNVESQGDVMEICLSPFYGFTVLRENVDVFLDIDAEIIAS